MDVSIKDKITLKQIVRDLRQRREFSQGDFS